MPKSIDYVNSFGVNRTSTIRAEFVNDDGDRFFVIGPVLRGPYDPSPPYDILQYNSDEHVLNY
jgi:hypothetical protein